MTKPRIKIIKDKESPESLELLAKSIIQVSEGFEELQKSQLTQRALIVLLHDGIGTSKITKNQIRLVLNNLPRLKYWYIK